MLDETRQGRFREDLYYRLRVLELALPPLRKRGRDVALLAEYFMDKYAQEYAKPVRGLAEEAAQALNAYPWPGNVRELANCIAGAVAFSRSELLDLADLPEHIRDHTPLRTEPLPSLEDVEKQHVARVLRDSLGNVAEAARVLGIGRQAVYQKIRKYGLRAD
jgi:transcriptional regulator with PAS, ATPase and Fis domain